ncbi:MAG: hypothetical protein V4569_09370 [Pseudomonadota bacterium]
MVLPLEGEAPQALRGSSFQALIASRHMPKACAKAVLVSGKSPLRKKEAVSRTEPKKLAASSMVGTSFTICCARLVEKARHPLGG